jgi:choloylglycine hydrolase
MCLQIRFIIPLLLLFIFGVKHAKACSILYYIDKNSGKIYAVNNEDYWWDTKAYIKILPSQKDRFARLWYGWDDFAQGGINEAGLFFDGAVTPIQPDIEGYTGPQGNLGDDILANCRNVDDAVTFLEKRKVALTNAHILFGDSTGNAVVVEWIDGVKKLISTSDNHLIATNYLLADTAKGNYPCHRMTAMKNEITRLEASNIPIGIKEVGNIAAKAVQPPRKIDGKTVGTLYSSFLNITDMKFILVFKLDNSKIIQLNLKKEFARGRRQTIKLK